MISQSDFDDRGIGVARGGRDLGAAARMAMKGCRKLANACAPIFRASASPSSDTYLNVTPMRKLTVSWRREC